ncbi:hypothetical protein NQ315_016242 [Exocentrus adspersus]|uniref:Tyr recombinase domain-containing protein n=1 Tax=Exocentrus adspersus TaxID=1586481 RepID=A0AAV8VIU9_9CUCU|nr:hypothetical protein NQ315_016242 [Exocentrus adspersus]
MAEYHIRLNCLVLDKRKIVQDKAEGIVVIPDLPAQPWYPLFKKLIHGEAVPLGPHPNLVSSPFRKEHPPSERPYPGCREIIGKAFLRKGILNSALETTLSSISEATSKQYNTTYKLWWNYCGENNVSLFDGTPSQVMCFLQDLFSNHGYRYGTLNSHRSALSLILPEGLGSDPALKRFMRGVSRLKPAKPRYNSTWDPKPVLNYLEGLSTSNNLKLLSQKLVTLLALITEGRLQTISLIRISNMSIDDEKIQIFISDPIKTPSSLGGQPCLHMLLSVKPHGTASKQTISRWVKETLKASGIDTEKFLPHSTRHASSSAAQRLGVSLEVICRTAGWSQQTQTFAKFYSRPLSKDTELAEAVLGLASK